MHKCILTIEDDGADELTIGCTMDPPLDPNTPEEDQPAAYAYAQAVVDTFKSGSQSDDVEVVAVNGA